MCCRYLIPSCFLTYATTKFEAESSDIVLIKNYVIYNYATRKALVKPHANKSIQYMKLIGKQSLFHMVWLIFTFMLYIFTT